MDSLFAQFIVEARDLLDRAGAELLRLERDPADADAVNELFRALHTLKGSTGLFDMPPFTRLMHAGEDALSAVRAGRARPTPELADRLFHLLDLAARWIDRLEDEEALPVGADGVAREQETLLRAVLGQTGGETAAAASAGFDWVERLRDETEAAGALTAVAYDPLPDCFFTGDDPLELCRRIPQLLALRIEPSGPWPALSDLDPYRCALRFRALSAAPQDAVAPVFRTVPDQVRLATLTPAVPAEAPKPAGGLPELAGAMLREQVRILTLPGGSAERAGRQAAVVRTVRNILTALGREGEHAALDRAAGAPEPLRRFLERLVEESPPAAGPDAAAPDTAAPDTAAPGTAAPDAVAEPAAAPGRRALRVEAERMDALMALVAELVVAKGRLPYLAREAQEGRPQDALAQGIKEVQAQLDGIAGALQEAVLRLRTLPLARVFDPLPRLVRDTARRLGKEVELRLGGGETEADKDILDILGEPLLHLVRNSLDHGVETPERRAAAGKPSTAEIRVQAFQDRDGVVVEVADDGAGIDPGRVRRKAAELGLIAAERAAALTDAEAVRLVLLPGLSTAAGVSDLSGRGVGMDAVRTAVERAGGRVEIASTPGTGTAVRLVLPLTMMITRVMVVEVAGNLYGLPVTLVGGMVRVPPDAVRRVKHAESVVLNDTVLPLVRLRRRLGLPEGPSEGGGAGGGGTGGGAGRRGEAVLVADLGGQRVGLVVDGFRERADVVLKPMAGVLARLRGYSGTAVLGDGRLLLVLNLRELL